MHISHILTVAPVLFQRFCAVARTREFRLDSSMPRCPVGAEHSLGPCCLRTGAVCRYPTSRRSLVPESSASILNSRTMAHYRICADSRKYKCDKLTPDPVQSRVRRGHFTYHDRCASTLPRCLSCRARRAMRRHARAHTREFPRGNLLPRCPVGAENSLSPRRLQTRAVRRCSTS